jgi:diguanylate cyclase (GGDEF)-like protein
LAGAQVHCTVVSIPNRAGQHVSASIRWTLLSGELGPHAILTIESQPQCGNSEILDALTQLPDRRALLERVAQWRHATAVEPPRFAVLFVDFNEFKAVNDQHGHAVGDVVLRTLADRLRNSIRDGDLATRYGGDEFVLLIHGATSAAEVEPVLARLTAAIEQPLCVSSLMLQLTATIGWAAPSSSDWTTDSLIAAADADMYARKRAMLR